MKNEDNKIRLINTYIYCIYCICGAFAYIYIYVLLNCICAVQNGTCEKRRNNFLYTSNEKERTLTPQLKRSIYIFSIENFMHSRHIGHRCQSSHSISSSNSFPIHHTLSRSLSALSRSNDSIGIYTTLICTYVIHII